jgi:hypothetical protein
MIKMIRKFNIAEEIAKSVPIFQILNAKKPKTAIANLKKPKKNRKKP